MLSSRCRKKINELPFLCSFPYSWGNLVVAIGGTTQSLLTKFEDVDEFLLLEEMRIKSMEGCKDVLSVKDHPKERKKKYLWEISKYICMYVCIVQHKIHLSRK